MKNYEEEKPILKKIRKGKSRNTPGKIENNES